MTTFELINKVSHRIRSIIINLTRNKAIYPKLYKTYWHSKFYKNGFVNKSNYFTAIPNPGAGIGHQMANWIAGYWFAKQFELQLAHYPFSNQKWDEFLGFGENEISVSELITSKGYQKVKLPLFNEFNINEVALIKKIISSYANKKVVFVCEQDQSYKDQFGVMDDLKRKFYGAKARKNDKLFYNPSNYNIAVHVRRGDIVAMKEKNQSNGNIRWLDNNYYVNVLNEAHNYFKTEKTIAIYLFSQGEKKDFREFEQFKNLTFCLDENPFNTFLHLVKADILITSRSSFSYKPALISEGVKICPSEFWHGYPKNSDFHLVEEYEKFELSKL